MIRKSASRTASAALLGLSLLAVTTAAIAQHGTKAGALVIEAPWTRATPGGAKVAGGYLKITNTGSTPDRLIGGTFPSAASVEVHEMSMTDGIMRMRRLEKGLEIAPGASVELKSGRYHLMFMGLSKGLEAGGTIKGTLVFEKAGPVEVEYRIAPIGSHAAPKHGH
jgi:hypothetical protein